MKITSVDTLLLRVPLKQRAITDSQSTVVFEDYFASFSADERADIFGRNAAREYRIGLSP